MSTFVERYRARRTAARRREAIERAIAKNPSQALRQELTSMMSRS
jgi:DNA-binding transcriptional regulator YdaS (Cro superfamily)